jgi:hypothetical protein
MLDAQAPEVRLVMFDVDPDRLLPDEDLAGEPRDRMPMPAAATMHRLDLPPERLPALCAFLRAAQMLGAIAQEGAKRVAGAFWAASKTRVGEAARGMTATVQGAVRTFVERLGFAASEPARASETPPKAGAERGA